MEFIPAISVMLFVLIIAIIVIAKLEKKQLYKIISADKVLILSAVFIFVITVAMHLYSSQNWTADLLKVVAGVVVGAGASAASSSAIAQMATGSEIQQAGRDIIGEMKGGIDKLSDSVVNQYSTIQKLEKSMENFDSRIGSLSPEIKWHKISVHLNDDTPEFVKALKSVNTDLDGWMIEYLDICLENPRIKQRLDYVISQWAKRGYRVSSIEPIDHGHNGIYCNFSLTKELSSK